jgi:hypothetical protein
MNLMSLFYLILVLAVIGFVVWLITTKIPMDPTIRTIIIVVVVIAICLWLMRAIASGGSFSFG